MSFPINPLLFSFLPLLVFSKKSHTELNATVCYDYRTGSGTGHWAPSLHPSAVLQAATFLTKTSLPVQQERSHNRKMGRRAKKAPVSDKLN